MKNIKTFYQQPAESFHTTIQTMLLLQQSTPNTKNDKPTAPPAAYSALNTCIHHSYTHLPHLPQLVQLDVGVLLSEADL